MIKTNSSIRFHFLSPCPLPDRRILKAFIVSVFKKEKRALEQVNIIYCGDEYLLGLNRQFLKHDFYTDILSFPLSLPAKPLEAEIYISIDRVRENAKKMGLPVNEELHRVIFHGILHLCGYKDKTQADIQEMRTLENGLLKAYFKHKA